MFYSILLRLSPTLRAKEKLIKKQHYKIKGLKDKLSDYEQRFYDVRNKLVSERRKYGRLLVQCDRVLYHQYSHRDSLNKELIELEGIAQYELDYVSRDGYTPELNPKESVDNQQNCDTLTNTKYKSTVDCFYGREL